MTGYLFLRTEILNFFVTVHLFLRTYDRILSYQDMGFVAVMMSLLRKTLTFLRTEMAIISQFQYIFAQHTFNFVAHSKPVYIIFSLQGINFYRAYMNNS